MKKLIATSLLFIHLFSIGGQLAFHQYLVYKSDKFFDEQIKKNLYSVDDLTEVMIPVNMPEIADWKSFQNLNGRVQFKNSSYNYVKMRVTRSAIYLMCVPNYETTHLADHNVIYARQIPDIPVSKKEHVPFGKVNIMAYSHQAIHYKFSTPLVMVRKTFFFNHFTIPISFIAGPGQPPDMETTVS